VLYAYLMHCSTMDIPKLKFRRDEIIEIIPAAYQNEAKRLHIPGLDPRKVPRSPEEIPGLSSPVEQQPPTLVGEPEEEETARPPEKIDNNTKDTLKDRLADED
jgi:6-phosphofructo-2-kinase/fructose-2,6-biphosphatase 4